MNTEFSNDRIVELLVKARSGTLSFEERAELELWLEADASRRGIYDRLFDEAYLQEQYKSYKACGRSDAWELLQRRMNAVVRRKKLIRGVTRWGMTSAAVLALAIGVRLAWTESKFSSAGSDNEIHYIVPGRNDAMIELSSGEKIILNEKRNNHVQLLAGAAEIVGDSMLRYDQEAKTHGQQLHEKHTFSVPKGATTKQLVLADGTQVWLNAGSSITYPVRFDGQERRVAMRGECYFDVSHDQNKPFFVDTQGIEIRVLGTQFNLMSYADDGQVATTLVSGSVELSTPERQVTITPGIQAVYDKSSCDFSLGEVDTRIYTAWKEGIFRFDNMNLEKICMVLNRWYDIDFVFEAERLKQMPFNGTLKRNRSLAFILDRISDTRTMSYTMESGRVVITRP